MVWGVMHGWGVHGWLVHGPGGGCMVPGVGASSLGVHGLGVCMVWGVVPGGDPPNSYCCGWYTSYWNAFLFLLVLQFTSAFSSIEHNGNNWMQRRKQNRNMASPVPSPIVSNIVQKTENSLLVFMVWLYWSFEHRFLEKYLGETSLVVGGDIIVIKQLKQLSI